MAEGALAWQNGRKHASAAVTQLPLTSQGQAGVQLAAQLLQAGPLQDPGPGVWCRRRWRRYGKACAGWGDEAEPLRAAAAQQCEASVV